MATDDNKQIELASQKIFELGVQNLIVILGENGTYLYNKDTSDFLKLFKIIYLGKLKVLKEKMIVMLGLLLIIFQMIIQF